MSVRKRSWVLPTPLRQLCWLFAILSIIAFLVGVAQNAIALIMIGIVVFVIFGPICLFFGFTDDD